jgi:hypothetical protein
LDQEAESLIGAEHDLSVGSVGPADGVVVVGKAAVPEGTAGTIGPPLSGRIRRVLLDGASVPVGQPITLAGGPRTGSITVLVATLAHRGEQARARSARGRVDDAG